MFPDLLIEGGKAKKDSWFKENQQQLMNLENMNNFCIGIESSSHRRFGGRGGNKLVSLEKLDQNIFISLTENWYLKNSSVE